MGEFRLDLEAYLSKNSINNVQGQLKQLQKTTTFRINEQGLQNAIRYTRTLKDESGQLFREIKQLHEKTGEWSVTMEKINQKTQSFGDIVGKVSKFLLATTIISAFTNAVYGSIEAVFQFDEALTEFKKVSDLSGDALEDYTNKLGELGSELGRTRTEMLESATLFKKAGFSEEDSAELARQAELFRNIADGQMTSADASAYLISQMKAFNLTAQESVKTLDMTNEVANNFAVQTSDIATALPKVASTMAQAGNTQAETIALLTAGAEMMPNQASRVARGLRSVTLSLQGLTDEGEKDLELLPKLQSNFSKIGISLTDENGTLKSTYQILKEMAEVYPTLDSNTRNYYSALVGGKTQVDIVNSVISNFNTALGANEVALNSAGSAMRENARYQESLEFTLNNLKAQLQELALNVINSQFVKSIINLGTAIVKFANSDIGQLIIKTTLLTTTILGFIKILGLLKATSIGSAIAMMTEAFIGMATGVATASNAMVGFKMIFTDIIGLINPAVLAIGAISIAIYGVNEAIEQSKKEYEEYAKSIEESTGVQTKSYSELKQARDETAKSLKDEIGTGVINQRLAKESIETLEKLTQKEKLSQYEKDKMQNAVARLNSLYPELGLSMDSTTGKLNMQIGAIRQATADYYKLAKASAYANAIQETTNQQVELLRRKDSLNEQLDKIQKDQLKTQKYAPRMVGGKTPQIVKTEEYQRQEQLYKKLAHERGNVLRELKQLDKDSEYYLEKYNALSAEIDVIQKQQDNIPYSGGGGGVSKASSARTSSAEKEIDVIGNLHDSYQELLKVLEHEMYIGQRKGESDEKQIERMKAIQSELHRQAESYRQLLPTASAEDKVKLDGYIRDCQKAWWDYYDKIVDAQQKALEEMYDQREEALKKLEKQLNKDVKLYNAQQKALERYASEQQEAIENQIKELDDKIDKQKESNDEAERAIELAKLEANLAKAKAKRIKVYKKGEGFVYAQDLEAIRDAERELKEFNTKNSSDERVKALENEKKALQEQKDEWGKYVNDIKQKQDKLMNEIELGMTEEQFINNKRIKNLKTFANAYEDVVDDIINSQKKLNKVQQDQEQLSEERKASQKEAEDKKSGKANQRAKQGTGGFYKVLPNSQAPKGLGIGDKVVTGGGTVEITDVHDDGSYESRLYDKSMTTKNFTGTYSHLAKGTTATKMSKYYNINEDGDELIVPPKGNLQYLQKGTGVVPKTLTENLMELGKFGVNGLKDLVAGTFGKNETNTYNYSFDKIVLPNVSDFNSFKSELTNFKNLAIQRAYSR